MKKTAALLLTGILLTITGCSAIGEKTDANTAEVSHTAESNKEETIEAETGKEETDEAEAGQEETGEAKAGQEETGEAEAGQEESVTEESEQAGTAGENEQAAADSLYIWQEVTLTLPEAWEGCYTVEEEADGFYLYQTASYGIYEGSGFVWGLFRTREAVEPGLGAQLVALTDDGILYYALQPLDLACGSEDERILGEYVRMCNEATLFPAFLDVSGAHCHAEEYILPTSSIYLLSEEELAGLSDNELMLARNEIYARHGRQFKNEYLQRYFDRCTWYEGTVSGTEFDEDMLTQMERDNLALLTAAEEAYLASHPYPKKYSANKMIYEDLDGDGSPEEILYQVDSEGRCLLTVNGNVCDATREAGYMPEPMRDCFYITDVSEEDGTLELAVLTGRPDEDPNTHFFLYREGTVSAGGCVPGFPFAEYNHGINGFSYHGNVKGRARMDLIETVYLTDDYWYDHDTPWISYRNTSVFHDICPAQGHELYEDLPVRYFPEETASSVIIPAQEQVFFLSSDMYRWILVKGKDGSMGYMRVEDGIIVDLGKPAEEVFSDLYFFD